jgi:hypothetical protein
MTTYIKKRKKSLKTYPSSAAYPSSSFLALLDGERAAFETEVVHLAGLEYRQNFFLVRK